MRLATYSSVSVAAASIDVKLAAWAPPDSVAMLSTLVDSLLDALASLFNLYAVNRALQPPDREHRFGHGKAEPLAALAQTAFISGSAIFLVIEAGHRIYQPRSVDNVELGVGVMIFSIVATFMLTRFQAYVIRRTGSLAIQADSLHYVGDLLANGVVVAALVLVSWFGWLLADPLFALGIAAYILYIAWQIARRALDMLMDRELSDEERDRIRQMALAHPEVLDLHDLRTRAAGRQLFIQLHLELDGTMNLYRAHRVADAVEAEIRGAYPEAEVMIHQDPHGIKEDHADYA